MIRVTQFGYASIGVSDLAAWRDYATQIIGLQVGEESEDELFLRMDEAKYRLHLKKDSRNDVLALGFSVPDEASLEGMIEQVKQAGVEVRYGTAQEVESRQVLGLIKFQDPNGVNLEVYYGLMMNFQERFRSPLPIAGFVTGEEGMGHFVVWPDDVETSMRFYCDVLGMKVTDWAIGYGQKAVFMHCNRRHHSIGLLPTPKPPVKRLHHIQLKFNSLDDLGRAYDLASKRDLLLATLGKHANEDAVSFYMKSPSGSAMELSWGGREIDETWQVTRVGPTASWGHEFRGLLDVGLN
jgi:2,3-dihydroxybiphenyl 1,2-dioxygenase